MFAYTMTLAEAHISSSLATVELAPTTGGTHLIYTEQGAYFDGADATVRRERGTRSLLERLAEELHANE
ncbi:MAG TPA: hypothetical protein VFX76_10100 [Roseiflexaceae bacterium]|nr:hypothetical protein [Roseiflexaceae bacterium]